MLKVQIPGKPRTWSPEGHPEVKFFIRILSGPTRRQIAREVLGALAEEYGVDVSEAESVIGQTAVGIAIGRAQARKAVIGWEGMEANYIDEPERIGEEAKFRPSLIDEIEDESVAIGLYNEIYRLHRKEVAAEKKSSDSGASDTGSECSPAKTSSPHPTVVTSSESEKAS